MKTEKPILLVISCVLQCIMSAVSVLIMKHHCAQLIDKTITQITLTALPQYKIEVTIGGYTNPESQLVISCNGFNCSRPCCDGFNYTSSLCHRCDSFFTYYLRNVN